MPRWPQFVHRVSTPRTGLLFFGLLAALLVIVVAMAATTSVAHADSRHLMCGWTAEPRTQTVYVDPGIEQAGVSRAAVKSAFASWNRLFVKYHGFPIFVEHAGNAATADIIIDARTFDRTWVDGRCNPKYTSLGKSHTTIYLGSKDHRRNADWFAHELGHALGLADHGKPVQHLSGHIGYKPCSNYYGVMSYCSSKQTWFMDVKAKGLYLDGQLVRDYWK